MRTYGLCLALLLPLVGCSLTIRNPRACLFDGVSVCPSGMICDPIQNECVLPGTETEGGAISDGGSPADLQCTSRFCQDSPSFTPGPLSSIWGSGPSDVWVTEIMGAIDRFDGSTWTQVRPPGGPGLYALSGVNPRLIWAAGAAGTILLWNGSTWTAQTSPTTVTLQGIWAVSASQVWAVGAQGMILNENYDSPIRTHTDPRMERSCKLPRRLT